MILWQVIACFKTIFFKNLSQKYEGKGLNIKFESKEMNTDLTSVRGLVYIYICHVPWITLDLDHSVFLPSAIINLLQKKHFYWGVWFLFKVTKIPLQVLC